MRRAGEVETGEGRPREDRGDIQVGDREGLAQEIGPAGNGALAVITGSSASVITQRLHWKARPSSASVRGHRPVSYLRAR